MNIKTILDNEIIKRNTKSELSSERPDPIMIAKKYDDEFVSFVCAMFAYGNAKLIVKFLRTLDFGLIDTDEETILQADLGYYRFQTIQDTKEFFITLNRLKKTSSIEQIFKDGFNPNKSTLEGIRHMISVMYDINDYRSRGYEFLLGSLKSKGAYKRHNMYLRWMIRRDNIDQGLWQDIDTSHLLIPLDTHTFNLSLKLGLLQRKTYDFKAVIELTNKLKTFDNHDPIKYDFALYRLGQEKIL